jgi:hypothetical protein
MPKGGSHHWVTAIFSPASKACLWWCQDGGEWRKDMANLRKNMAHLIVLDRILLGLVLMGLMILGGQASEQTY